MAQLVSSKLQMGDATKDLVAGTIAGVAHLICGHPFDTIKVKIQSQPAPTAGRLPKFAGAMDAVRQTIAAEGPKGLYRGMSVRLATAAALSSTLHTARGRMEALLRSQPGAPLTVGQQFVCGSGAGVAVSFLTCPVELIKCRLQAQSVLANSGAAVKYRGPLDVAGCVLKSEGGVRGLFKGYVPTLWRGVVGNAVMFGVYEFLKQSMAGGMDTSKLDKGCLMVAGGVAGGSFWAVAYPIDVVKSKLQVDDYRNPKYKGSIDVFKKIMASEGAKGLYKGFSPAIARSVVAYAAGFMAYEVSRTSLGR